MVIGSGPYGLSLAAHLSAVRADFRLFGKPMETWKNHVPKGMLLKSDGFATNLSAPGGGYHLRDYCANASIPYDDLAIPVRLKTFVDYAHDFRRRYVPTLDERSVVDLARSSNGFALKLEDGEEIRSRQVVIAVGITHFEYLPPVLVNLRRELITHSSAHHDVSHFKDRDVTIIGAGSSAVDLAVLLHDCGSKVRLVARRPSIRFGSAPTPLGRTRWNKIRHPRSGLGPGLRSFLACEAPDLFRYLPQTLRIEIVRRHLGPASAWHLEPRMESLPMMLGYQLVNAELSNGRVALSLRADDGSSTTIETDQVIAATGYRPDIDRLCFIDESIRSSIDRVGQMPELSRNFESSIPGLFFVGAAAANSFGPLMRFVFGCEFAAPRIGNYVSRVGR